MSLLCCHDVICVLSRFHGSWAGSLQLTEQPEATGKTHLCETTLLSQKMVSHKVIDMDSIGSVKHGNKQVPSELYAK